MPSRSMTARVHLLAVNKPDQKSGVVHETSDRGLTVLRVGTVDQTLLQPAGDDTRIDWGYAYVAAPARRPTAAVGTSRSLTRAVHCKGRSFRRRTIRRKPRSAANERSGAWRLLSTSARVGSRPVVAARHDRLRRDLRHQVSRPEAAAVLAARTARPRRICSGRPSAITPISCGDARRLTPS